MGLGRDAAELLIVDELGYSVSGVASVPSGCDEPCSVGFLFISMENCRLRSGYARVKLAR